MLYKGGHYRHYSCHSAGGLPWLCDSAVLPQAQWVKLCWKSLIYLKWICLHGAKQTADIMWLFVLWPPVTPEWWRHYVVVRKWLVRILSCLQLVWCPSECHRLLRCLMQHEGWSRNKEFIWSQTHWGVTYLNYLVPPQTTSTAAPSLYVSLLSTSLLFLLSLRLRVFPHRDMEEQGGVFTSFRL